jgi:hypothetical protein
MDLETGRARIGTVSSLGRDITAGRPVVVALVRWDDGTSEVLPSADLFPMPGARYVEVA